MDRSPKYLTVEKYYKGGFWSLNMARNAVGRWITSAEFQEITGEVFEEG